jgi:hypothetical protein
MKWSAADTSNNGVGCYLWFTLTNNKWKPNEVTAKNADDVQCRMDAGTSRTHVSTDRDAQGFSDVYRRACERIAVDPKTPKYAAIDIIMWLTLTDPHVFALKPGTLVVNILDRDDDQIDNCWKCLTIIAMSMLNHERPEDAVQFFQKAMEVVKRDTGSVPAWLTSRIDIATEEAAKQNGNVPDSR